MMFWVAAEEISFNKPVSFTIMKRINESLTRLKRAFITKKLFDNFVDFKVLPIFNMGLQLNQS